MWKGFKDMRSGGMAQQPSAAKPFGSFFPKSPGGYEPKQETMGEFFDPKTQAKANRYFNNEYPDSAGDAARTAVSTVGGAGGGIGLGRLMFGPVGGAVTAPMMGMLGAMFGAGHGINQAYKRRTKGFHEDEAQRTNQSPGGYMAKAHPRHHALAMASATHLLNMGYLHPDQHAHIAQQVGSALKMWKGFKDMRSGGMAQQPSAAKPFGSFFPKSPGGYTPNDLAGEPNTPGPRIGHRMPGEVFSDDPQWAQRAAQFAHGHPELQRMPITAPFMEIDKYAPKVPAPGGPFRSSKDAAEQYGMARRLIEGYGGRR
jgi:hypothetical protein